MRVKVSEKLGYISTMMLAPDDATHLMILGHGAGAGMKHPFMQALAEALAQQRIATLRYQFPYMEQGKKRPDYPATTHLTIAKVIEFADQNTDLPMVLAGKSFSGRMASQYVANHPDIAVQALIFYGFPLHSPAKPGIERAEHLADVHIPMLFLQGDRDALAKLPLLKSVTNDLPLAEVKIFTGANHSFKFLKKSGVNQEEAMLQLANMTRLFLDRL